MRFLHRRRIVGTYWRIHEKKLKTFPCQECNLSFTSLFYLTRVHARTETQPKNNAFGMFPIRQNFCRKKAISHDTYKTHAGQKDHKCTECEKKFVRSGELRIHLRIHTGQKPYKCSQCQKSFSQKNTLNYHMKIHAGVRLFSCTHCEKPFLTNDDLKKHLKIHYWRT